ncbi:MAG: ABC transporter ATP-binding protein [Ilumatobacteraceae bacterium]
MHDAPHQPVLQVDGLVRRFGERVAVDEVSFQISAGETYGLLGPNGAGKTTTISMIAGILAADAGTVHVAGIRVTTDANPQKRLVGYVPQQIALFDDLTARENLRFFGGLQGLRGKRLDDRIAATMEMVGLADRADDRIDTYSGGMQRRANIAVGLLHEPTLLILDEPTAGVDPQSRNQILESIEQLSRAGLSVLYTTHYMEEAERLCDRVGIIDGGRLIAEGTRRELVAQVGEHDRIVVSGDEQLDAFATRVRSVGGVADVTIGDRQVEVMAVEAAAVLAGVVTCAVEAGMSVTGVEVHEPNLESVFLQLTGKALRDGAE